MTRSWILVFALWLGCSTGPTGPVEPVWGKQACSHCMMLLSEPAPSAQLLSADGTRRFFDDVGCLAEWLDRHPHDAAAAWVRSADQHGWQRADAARFVDGQRTPMDYGFLPSKSGVSFAALREAVRNKAQHREMQP